MNAEFRFADIMVVGSGSLTLSVAEHLAAQGRRVTLVEIPEAARFSIRARAERKGIPVETVAKKDAPSFFEQRAKQAAAASFACPRPCDSCARKPLLVLSVENMYVFPRSIAEHPSIEILNYHNSLLPRHRGMHAEAWAIFEDDDQFGFTWHLVDASLDTGHIIYQEAFNTTQSETSLELLGKCSKQALEAFRRFFDHYEQGSITPLRQSDFAAHRCTSHNRHERPNGGFLDVTWNLRKIASFLRSYDYGKLRSLGTPSVVLDGKHYTWKSYSIEMAGAPTLGETTVLSEAAAPGEAPASDAASREAAPGEASQCACHPDFVLGRVVFTDKRQGRITLNGLQAAPASQVA